MVKTLFADQRHIILLASASAKPPDDKIGQILKPVSEGLEKISKIKDANRAGQHRDLFNHLSTVAEGVPAVGWLVVVSGPITVFPHFL